MDLSLSKESVYVGEIIYDGQTEQGVDLDYVLPDYYPDIFKILKCTLTPRVTSFSVSGSQLFCDGVVYIKVLYLTAEGNRIFCIDQRYTYSKTFEMGKSADGAMVGITPKTDYVNCRAVSGRRIDVRGAVSSKIKVTCKRESEIITGAQGLGTQTKQTELDYSGDKLTASVQFISREDIETGTANDGAASVVHSDASAAVTDYKVIANKVIIKGEAQIKALYFNQKDDEDSTAEVMEATIPVNQIVDLAGVTDKHQVFPTLSVLDCDLELKPGSSGDNRVFSCDLTLLCNVSASKEEVIAPVSDAYSTDYELNYTTGTIKAETMPQIINEQLSLKSTIESGDGDIAEVYDARADVSNLVYRVRDGNELVITGQATFQIVGRLENGTPAVLEKTEPFEAAVEVGDVGDDYSINPNLQVTHVTYSITSDNQADVRATLNLRAALYKVIPITIVNDMTVNKSAPKQKDTDYALKLYYAEEGEDIWLIAKRYNTDADAIAAENDLADTTIRQPSMLLIPIV
jgi:hypothetical protein